MKGDHRKSLKIAVCEFYNLHIDKGKEYTIKKYQNAGIPRSRMMDWLDKGDKTGNCERKPGSGGQNRKLTQATKKKIEKMVKNKVGVSQRKIANTSQCY